MTILTTWGIIVVVEFLGKDIYHCDRYMYSPIVWGSFIVLNCVFFNTHEVARGTSFFTK